MRDRGVWEMPYLDASGHRILAAIDSQGRRIREIILFPGLDEAEAERLLWGVLNRRDVWPQRPRLWLVKELPPPTFSPALHAAIFRARRLTV